MMLILLLLDWVMVLMLVKVCVMLSVLLGKLVMVVILMDIGNVVCVWVMKCG